MFVIDMLSYTHMHECIQNVPLGHFPFNGRYFEEFFFYARNIAGQNGLIKVKVFCWSRARVMAKKCIFW